MFPVSPLVIHAPRHPAEPSTQAAEIPSQRAKETLPSAPPMLDGQRPRQKQHCPLHPRNYILDWTLQCNVFGCASGPVSSIPISWLQLLCATCVILLFQILNTVFRHLKFIVPTKKLGLLKQGWDGREHSLLLSHQMWSHQLRLRSLLQNYGNWFKHSLSCSIKHFQYKSNFGAPAFL